MPCSKAVGGNHSPVQRSRHRSGGSSEEVCISHESRTRQRDLMVNVSLTVAGRALVCGHGFGAFDTGGEDQRAEDNVPASGHRCVILQPASPPQHLGEPALSQQYRAHH